MTNTTFGQVRAADAADGLAVHCTQGALGEWFTLIPRSSQRAQDLRRCGVVAGASLTSDDVRRRLARLGLPGDAIDHAVARARRAATTITVQRSGVALLHRLFG